MARVRKPKTNLSGQLQLIASDIDNMDTMDNRVDIIRYVPTILPSFNRGIVLGGAPLGCVWTLHGEYAGGKSSLAVIIVSSFAENGHLALFIDAEHAASKVWFQQLGANPVKFNYYRPKYLEDMSNAIDDVIENFDIGKKKGDIEDDKGLIIVVDSINKLTPMNEFERFKKEGAEALEKGLARTRGNLLQSWLDHITPVIGERDIALVCIAQERIIQDAKPWEIDFKVKGCQGLMYDSSVQIRVSKGKKQWEGSDKKKVLVGFEHKMHFIKNKVGFPMETGSFYTSNGKGDAPIGLDLAKTVYNEAILRGSKHFTKSSGCVYYKGEKFRERQLLKLLRNDVDTLNDICIDLDSEITTNNEEVEDVQ